MMQSGLVIALEVLVLGWLGLRWFEHANLYFPDREIVADPQTYGLAYEDVSFSSTDGTSLRGWYIPSVPEPPAAQRRAILFCHGNAGNISHRLDKAALMHHLGADVFLFDYRGYGRSRGRSSETGLYRDGEGALRYLTETRAVPLSQIILYGESLGCAVAVELAVPHAVRGVILESPFTSTAEMARVLLPALPLQRVLHDRYDNLAKIHRVREPLLILHSPQDDIVPYAMGRRLFDAASGPKTFVDLHGDHNSGYEESLDIYAQALKKFLSFNKEHKATQD